MRQNCSYGVRLLGQKVVAVLKHYREDIVEKELELERIADSAIALFTMAAVISKLIQHSAVTRHLILHAKR